MNLRRASTLTAVGLIAATLGCRPDAAPLEDVMSDRVGPESLARLVETSSAIVVARFEAASDLGTVTLAAGGAPDEGGGPPELSAGLVGTRMMVDEVLKPDGAVRATAAITYGVFGAIPQTAAEREADAAAPFPLDWPAGTEFVLFLNREPGRSTYYIPYGECGRILTDGASVACSDGERTVPGFLAGLSRQALLDAIVAEVARQDVAVESKEAHGAGPVARTGARVADARPLAPRCAAVCFARRTMGLDVAADRAPSGHAAGRHSGRETDRRSFDRRA